MVGDRQCWQTPQDFFDLLDSEFNFDVDVAADENNSKCRAYIDEEDDGLRRPWFRLVGYLNCAWCNPPYANPMPWVIAAHENTEAVWGSVAVLLLNHDASTKWYSYALEHASEIRILTGKRIQFVPPDGIKASTNSKGQCVIIFRKKLDCVPCHVWHWNWKGSLDERAII